MIEAMVREYLAGLAGVPVLMELPEVPSEDFPTWPDRFVVVEKVGERAANRIHTASVALQSYSLQSLYGAADLDREVRGLMDGFSALPSVGACRMRSDYNFTDARTKRYRYQCVYEIAYVE